MFVHDVRVRRKVPVEHLNELAGVKCVCKVHVPVLRGGEGVVRALVLDARVG